MRMISKAQYHHPSLCAWKEQQFHSGRRHTYRLSFTYLWSNLNVSEPTLGVVGNGAWATEAREWDLCYASPYSTVPAKMYVSKYLHLDLQCAGL
ncbi:hypothetical protein TNCV_553701 [Trichonephila clavipes]|nr:hypothetical protein TNCV_553701 [Trichonephila clavipes]